MEEIKETGYVYNGKVELDTSSIFSRLILEAGRWCESYASDIIENIDDIKSVLSKVPSEWSKNKKRFAIMDGNSAKVEWRFGFRRKGVDYAGWIDDNLKNDCRKYYYRSIWKLVLEATDDKVTATLTRQQ